MTNSPSTAVLTGPDVGAFRAAMGCFPTGVTVLTQGSDADTIAMTLNSLTSVSLDPMLLLVSVKADGRMRPRIAAAGSFAVNVLSRGDQALSAEFCRPDRPEGVLAMQRLGAVTGVTGNAVLPSAVASLECRLRDQYVAGDHVLLVGEVLALHGGARTGSAEPLVFHRGGYSALRKEESA
ncbi:flavin reductase family protein [Streptomyces sparsus]